MSEPVMLKLSVEGMKHQMVHAFTKHSVEIEEAIKKACDRYIASGQIQTQVNEAFDKAVKDAIQSYFSYGEGYKAVHDAVNKGIPKAFRKKKGRSK